MMQHSISDRARVMLVDDEANILGALKRALRSEEYELDFAANAEEALCLMQQQDYELIVSDYNMPGTNGVSLLKQVKKLQPQTIRILLTGESDTTQAMGELQDGAIYKFILKPWDNEDIRFTLKRAIERNRSGQLATQADTLTKINTGLDIKHNSKLPMVLEQAGFINRNESLNMAEMQARDNVSVVQQLIENELLSECEIFEAIKTVLQPGCIQPDLMQLSASLLAIFPRDLCETQVILPISLASDSIVVACADPTNNALFDELSYLTGRSITPVVAPVYSLYNRIMDSGLFEIDEPGSTSFISQIDEIGLLIEKLYTDLQSEQEMDMRQQAELISKIRNYREQLSALDKKTNG